MDGIDAIYLNGECIYPFQHPNNYSFSVLQLPVSASELVMWQGEINVVQDVKRARYIFTVHNLLSDQKKEFVIPSGGMTVVRREAERKEGIPPHELIVLELFDEDHLP